MNDTCKNPEDDLCDLILTKIDKAKMLGHTKLLLSLPFDLPENVINTLEVNNCKVVKTVNRPERGYIFIF